MARAARGARPRRGGALRERRRREGRVPALQARAAVAGVRKQCFAEIRTIQPARSRAGGSVPRPAAQPRTAPAQTNATVAQLRVVRACARDAATCVRSLRPAPLECGQGFAIGCAQGTFEIGPPWSGAAPLAGLRPFMTPCRLSIRFTRPMRRRLRRVWGISGRFWGTLRGALREPHAMTWRDVTTTARGRGATCADDGTRRARPLRACRHRLRRLREP
jgi:hypothetical protein